MTDPTAPAVTVIEQKSDLGTGDSATWAYWMGQEAIAERKEERWHKQGDLIVKRFRDERPGGPQSDYGNAGDSKFNVLWSNTKTLAPVLYGRTPKPDVDRRFKDGATPTARYAALILQRCLTFVCDTGCFDAVMKPVVQDRLLPGRGVARVLYVPHFGEPIEAPAAPDQTALESQAEQSPGGVPSPNMQQTPQLLGSPAVEADEEATDAASQAADAVTASPGDDKKDADREVVYEEVKLKYIYWKDYREGPARQWDEVPWTRYRSYLTRDELTQRFGAAKAKLVNLDYTPEGHVENEKHNVPPDMFKKAIVLEFWDKAKRKVTWIAPGTSDLVLDEQDDPLGLPDFFPNPDPLLANITTDCRIPVPDYVEYQDQAQQLDRLSGRIDRLTKALKVAGVYPGEEKAVLQQLIDEGTENCLIPVHDWQNWSDKGGLEGFIQWVPLKQIAETLIQLYDARDRVKAILYELTGIGDIMRGMTSPDETLGAQELKSVFATRRISPEQKNVANFARDLMRLMGAVIAGHFSDKTISEITGFPQLAPVPQLPPPPQASPQVSMEIQAHLQAAASSQPQPGQIGGPEAVAPSPAAPAGMGAPAAGPHPAQPAGGNVVPMLGQPVAAPPPGAGPSGVAPQPPPLSPQAQQYQQAMQQYMQAQKQVQAIQQANQKKQADFAAACQLIREDGVHGFKIDIEADSTIAPDEQAEKAARTEFLGKFVPLMEQVVPLAMGNPALSSLAKEICLFGVRAFPAARPLEETIEQAFDAIAKMPPQPPPGAKGAAGKQGPSPQDLALRNKEDNTRLQIAREKNAVEMANMAQDDQQAKMKLAAETEHDRAELALKVGTTARKDALAGARLTHIETQNANGLV